MLDLAANDPIIKAYLHDIRHLNEHRAAKRRGWTLVPELSTYSGGKRVVPDGTVRDEYRLARGWWEAKDTGDNLGAEIQKKLKTGYPARNTIFEDTRVAVLYQDRERRASSKLDAPVKVAELLKRFFTHDEAEEREFHRAMDEFKSRIPDLARSLRESIAEGHKKNRKFQAAFAEFLTLCRGSLNPELSEDLVDEMLIQHLLTERLMLMRNLFQNPEFTRKNVIAAQIENVIDALAIGSFSRAAFFETGSRQPRFP